MDFQVNVVTGHRLLGGFIGSFDEMQKWIYKKVTDWATSIDCLSKAAVYEPHLVNVSLTRSLQNEWNYVQRVISDVDNPFALLKLSRDLLKSHFSQLCLEQMLTQLKLHL